MTFRHAGFIHLPSADELRPAWSGNFLLGTSKNTGFCAPCPCGGIPCACRRLWVYDLCTNKKFTAKTDPLQRSDLEVFVSLYQGGTSDQRQPSRSKLHPEGR